MAPSAPLSPSSTASVQPAIARHLFRVKEKMRQTEMAMSGSVPPPIQPPSKAAARKLALHPGWNHKSPLVPARSVTLKLYLSSILARRSLVSQDVRKETVDRRHPASPQTGEHKCLPRHSTARRNGRKPDSSAKEAASGCTKSVLPCWASGTGLRPSSKAPKAATTMPGATLRRLVAC